MGKECLFNCHLSGKCQLYYDNACEGQCKKIFEVIINLAMLDYAKAMELVDKLISGAYFMDELLANAEYQTLLITGDIENFMRKQGKTYLPLCLPKFTPALSPEDWNKALTISGLFFKAVGQGKALKRVQRAEQWNNNNLLKKSS